MKTAYSSDWPKSNHEHTNYYNNRDLWYVSYLTNCLGFFSCATYLNFEDFSLSKVGHNWTFDGFPEIPEKFPEVWVKLLKI